MKKNRRQNRPEHDRYLKTWKPKIERYVKDKHGRWPKGRETDGENKSSFSTQC